MPNSLIPTHNIMCLECNKIFKNRLALSTHVFARHHLNTYEYVDKYYTRTKCKFCDEYAKRFNAWTSCKTCGSHACLSKICSRNHTKETKEKIREARLRSFCERNGSSAWEKRNAKKMSFLEKWFFENIIEKHKLPTMYKIIAEHRVLKFLVDYAFIDQKIAVELDGKCHFTNGNARIESDIIKDKTLQSMGWRVYRIAWDEIRNTPDDVITSFLTMLHSHNDVSTQINGVNYFWDRQTSYHANRIEREKIQEQKKIERTQLHDNIENTRFQQLQAIDTTKFGWVTIISKLWCITPAAAGRYIRRTFPAYYNEKCFQRK